MPQPLVSVILPCFNPGTMLRPALLSVVRQTYTNIEIVFVDNNSSDGSADTARRILEASNRSFTITHCVTQGSSFARNHGYQFIRGDYVQWMDADDELNLDKIARQIVALEGSPEDAIAYGDWTSRKFLPRGPPLLIPRPLRPLKDHIRRTLAGVWYPPHLYLLRRSAADLLQSHQAFWPGRPVAMDIEYFAVAALLGLRFRHVAGAHVYYNNWSAGQVSYSTPYGLRTATLREIYLRLQALAETLPIAHKLGRDDRTLLRQNWNSWIMPKGSVEIARASGRHLRLRHVASGKEIPVRPTEAVIASALMSDPMPRAPLHHAVRIAESVAELRDHHAFIAGVLERFGRAGLMERADVVTADHRATEPGDTAAPS